MTYTSECECRGCRYTQEIKDRVAKYERAFADEPTEDNAASLKRSRESAAIALASGKYACEWGAP